MASRRALTPSDQIKQSKGAVMATDTLKGRRVAILVTDGFEQDELLQPRKALDEAGAQTKVVSPKSDRVRGWKHKEWGVELNVDVPLEHATTLTHSCCPAE
jgi:putative intracellular protease/amidase